MRYRQDVPRGADLTQVARDIVAHLAAAADPNDDPHGDAREDVVVNVYEHIDGDPDMVTVIGEISAQPDAPYLRTDYDPAADHAGIEFKPFEQPELGRFADPDALGRFLRGEGW